ncbi:uncharacterized protein LOC143024141 isoform X3 [Oratosquilla oratoria]|uniref:uncharacterized protein LOC143024141 isoform X3 n=1 Tax=Oratosquilla oratoria TaxID=337810 RepID=UPI003F7681E4
MDFDSPDYILSLHRQEERDQQHGKKTGQETLLLDAMFEIPGSDMVTAARDSSTSTPVLQPGSSSTPVLQPGSSSTPLLQPGSSSTPVLQPDASSDPVLQPDGPLLALLLDKLTSMDRPRRCDLIQEIDKLTSTVLRQWSMDGPSTVLRIDSRN